MGFYDAAKDAINMVQKVDNIELYQKLLDLSKLALDMQEENEKLTKENKELKENQNIEERIIRDADKTCFSLKDDEKDLIYCSVCWDKEKKLIQVAKQKSGRFKCHLCDNNGEYDIDLYKRWSYVPPRTDIF